MSPRHPAAVLTCAGLTLLVGCGSPVAELPSVTGSPMSEAVAELEAAGFTVSYEDDAPDVPEHWLVAAQKPDITRAEKGSEVVLALTSVLERAADRCGAGGVGDSGSSIDLDMEGDDAFSGDLTISDVTCVLDELGVPDSVMSKMEATRSLDGRQTEDWGGIEATWTYHPDDGLDVILELQN